MEVKLQPLQDLQVSPTQFFIWKLIVKTCKSCNTCNDLFGIPNNSHSHRFSNPLPTSTCVSRARRGFGLYSQILDKQNLPEWDVVWRQMNKKDNVLPDVSSKEYLPISDTSYSGCNSLFLVNLSNSTLLLQPESYSGLELSKQTSSFSFQPKILKCH